MTLKTQMSFMKQCAFTKAKLIGALWQIYTGFPVIQSILYTACI